MAAPWEMNWTGQQPGDPIIAGPDPYKQSEERRAVEDQSIQRTTADLQNQLTKLTIGEKQAKADERAEKEAAAKDADERAAYKLLKAISEMQRIALDADDNGGFMETGTSGNFARTVLPDGTAGYDLAGDIKTLDANFAFDALQAMRDASKTGGALGQVTERELDLLKSSVANLDPNLSHETFLANVERARQTYLAKLAMIDPGLATSMGYDADKAEAGMRAINDEYNKRFGAAQQISFDRSVQEERPPLDIEEIMAKYGAQ